MYISLKMAANLLIKAVSFFGINNQKRKAEEELTELILALKRDQDGRPHNVEEELADVIIMIEQLKLIYDQGKIMEWIEIKLERLERRTKGNGIE